MKNEEKNEKYGVIYYMHTETKTKVVPEQTKEMQVYIADDGTEFDNWDDCKKYEIYKEVHYLHEMPVIKYCVQDANNFEYVDSKLFYIENQHDFEVVLFWMGERCRKALDTDYDTYGSGWYIYSEEINDYCYCSLLNYNNYVKSRMYEIKDLIEENRRMINEVEESMKGSNFLNAEYKKYTK